MEDAHTLSIDSHVNLASRATAAEAEAFMQAFSFHIKTTTESDALVHIRYFHRHTGRYYHVSATSLEMEEDLSRDFLQKLTDLFPWAIQKEEEGRKELSGRLLGVSGRVDGLQGCDVGKAAGMESGRSVKVDDLALVLCHPNGPCGELGKLPRELRDEVYKHAFPSHLLAMLSHQAPWYHFTGRDALQQPARNPQCLKNHPRRSSPIGVL